MSAGVQRNFMARLFHFFDVAFCGDASAIKPPSQKALFVTHGVLWSRKRAELMFQVFMVKLGLQLAGGRP
jgi:hypothetical protein